MSEAKKRTIKRKVRMKGVTTDFGLGEGILYQDEVTLIGAYGAVAAASLLQRNKELLESLFEVTLEEVI